MLTGQVYFFLFAAMQEVVSPIDQTSKGVDWSIVLDVLVAFCAIAAFGLSMYQEVLRRTGNRRRIQVTMRITVRSRRRGQRRLVMLVEALNVGQRAVILDEPATIRLPNREMVKAWELATPEEAGSDVQFPYELAPDRRCTSWIDVRRLADWLSELGQEGIVQFTGVYVDQAGRQYTGEAFDFDLEEWADMQVVAPM